MLVLGDPLLVLPTPGLLVEGVEELLPVVSAKWVLLKREPPNIGGRVDLRSSG